jgi:predicted HicB family RNase H-like nuclease
MRAEKQASSGKKQLNMQLDAELLKTAHEMAEEDAISLSGLVRQLLIREKKRRDAEKKNSSE